LALRGLMTIHDNLDNYLLSEYLAYVCTTR
jgi:hypothetical protein